MNALDKMTSKATAFPTFADLEAACKSGYVPTLRTDQHCYNEYLAAELIHRGYRVYRGEAWS